jgi:hypothetical protein
LSWDLQRKEQSGDTLFVQILPRTSQHHFSANLWGMSVHMPCLSRWSTWGKEISSANTKNESQRESGLEDQFPDETRTESRYPTGICTDAAPRYCICQRTPRRLSFLFFCYEPGQVLNRRIGGLGNVGPLCQSYKFTFWLWRFTRRSALPCDSLSTIYSYESLGRDSRHLPS